jgi:hypothetical protein
VTVLDHVATYDKETACCGALFYRNKIGKLTFVYSSIGIASMPADEDVTLSKDSSPLGCDTVLLDEWFLVF